MQSVSLSRLITEWSPSYACKIELSRISRNNTAERYSLAYYLARNIIHYNAPMNHRTTNYNLLPKITKYNNYFARIFGLTLEASYRASERASLLVRCFKQMELNATQRVIQFSGLFVATIAKTCLPLASQ